MTDADTKGIIVFNFNKLLLRVKYESFSIDDKFKVLTESTNCSVLTRILLHAKLNNTKVIRERLKRRLGYETAWPDEVVTS